MIQYGELHHLCVLNKDQAPIAISSTYDSNVDNTGEEYTYDAVVNDNGFHILCTMDLMIPMKAEENLSNLPKPGVVFSATKFMTADYWHDQE